MSQSLSNAKTILKGNQQVPKIHTASQNHLTVEEGRKLNGTLPLAPTITIQVLNITKVLNAEIDRQILLERSSFSHQESGAKLSKLSWQKFKNITIKFYESIFSNFAHLQKRENAFKDVADLSMLEIQEIAKKTEDRSHLKDLCDIEKVIEEEFSDVYKQLESSSLKTSRQKELEIKETTKFLYHLIQEATKRLRKEFGTDLKKLNVQEFDLVINEILRDRKYADKYFYQAVHEKITGQNKILEKTINRIFLVGNLSSFVAAAAMQFYDKNSKELLNYLNSTKIVFNAKVLSANLNETDFCTKTIKQLETLDSKIAKLESREKYDLSSNKKFNLIYDILKNTLLYTSSTLAYIASVELLNYSQISGVAVSSITFLALTTSTIYSRKTTSLRKQLELALLERALGEDFSAERQYPVCVMKALENLEKFKIHTEAEIRYEVESRLRDPEEKGMFDFFVDEFDLSALKLKLENYKYYITVSDNKENNALLSQAKIYFISQIATFEALNIIGKENSIDLLVFDNKCIRTLKRVFDKIIEDAKELFKADEKIDDYNTIFTSKKKIIENQLNDLYKEFDKDMRREKLFKTESLEKLLSKFHSWI